MGTERNRTENSAIVRKKASTGCPFGVCWSWAWAGGGRRGVEEFIGGFMTRRIREMKFAWKRLGYLKRIIDEFRNAIRRLPA